MGFIHLVHSLCWSAKQASKSDADFGSEKMFLLVVFYEKKILDDALVEWLINL